MVEEESYETTRMVAKHTEKENIEKVYSHTNPFIRNFIRRSIKGGSVSANRKSFETNKMDEICNVLKEFISLSDTESISRSIQRINETKTRVTISLPTEMDTTPAPSRATTLPNQTPKRARSSPTPSPADIGSYLL
ncbi:hypothetical protein LOTGIDRAFT_161004 [Lottia gigantea]|uniref:Uncharacterized protein n=1 Tax=Lottia gigantea TaxID=225164 RepID=V3ZTH1_LOTGI|nr:hypothetical protein LOTGIDRAFT_161004 [Lottia gigantea]ESO94758.1 hypothetical protein LOTGIDRAFT_161004 [Lottia gigantea]